ncbi:choice-of-anchor D domain-containing protein [Longispora urticae]
MRLLRSAIIAAVALTVTAFIPPSLASAAAPTAPYDAFTVERWGTNYVFDKSNSSISISPNLEFFNFSGSNAEHNYSLGTRPPEGKLWEAGKTYPAERAGNDPAKAWLTVSGDGFGCNAQVGTIAVKEVGRDADGHVNKFAASYTASCESTEIVYRGEFRWHSTIGYAAATTSPGNVGFGDQQINVPGTETTVTYTSAGSEPAVFGTPVLGGTAPGQFAITGGTCKGATVAYGQTCTVKVQAKPTAAGAHYAELVLPANMADGKKVTTLSQTGVDPYAGNKGTYTTLNPARILDTRSGNGAPAAKVGRAGILHLQVGGRGGVPSQGVSAVTLNVTVTDPSAESFLTLFPKGVARPTASSLNFLPGWTGANSVTVKVGPDGGVDIYNHDGATHVIVDVMGYYAENDQAYSMGGLFHPMTPRRLIDTRNGGGALLSDYYLRSALNFGAGNSHIRAWAVNITATAPVGQGFLTAWNGDIYSLQETSTLNYRQGETVPNMAIVPTAACSNCSGGAEGWPSIGVYAQTTTHVIVDIVGFFDDGYYSGDGLRFDPITPTRIVDTRDGLGAPGALGQATTTKVTAPGAVLNTAGGATSSLALNVTAVYPSIPTVVTLWGNGIDGQSKPGVSNLNPQPGKVTPNAAITQIGPSNAFNVYNHGGNVHLVVDVVGRFYFHPVSGGSLRMAPPAAGAPTAGPSAGQSYQSAHTAA